MVNKAVIQSVDNPRIKTLRKLYHKKYRSQLQSFLIEGEKILFEVLHNNTLHEHYVVKELYISDSFTFTLVASELIAEIPHWIVSDKVFSNVSSLQSPRGCIAVVEHRGFALADTLSEDYRGGHVISPGVKQIVLLDGVQDPGNVGAIIRIADAVGAQAVLLGQGSADPFSDKVVRAAMGSLFHLPIFESPLIDAIRQLKTAGYRILAADLGGTPYYALEPSGSVAWVFGNEGQGISQSVKQEIDQFVTIPMPGKAESLNVSVAAGILAFDMAHRRQL